MDAEKPVAEHSVCLERKRGGSETIKPFVIAKRIAGNPTRRFGVE